MKYSKTTGGFYSDAICYNVIPDDVVEITEDKHAELLSGYSTGKTISSDENGNPVLIALSGPTIDDLAARARTQRDDFLRETDWRIIVAMESGNSISEDLKIYRQALRDLPAQAGFPDEITWPVPIA